ncbi:MAG: hypothetical protein IJB21_04960 [Bacilli bacterium]|nr:hypothetical protein [Bacilli bacterium]
MNFIKLDYSVKEIDDILKIMALITVETTSWIYGEDMGSSENIKMYIEHKKKAMPITYLMYDGEKVFAYLTLSISDSILYIEDVHILKDYRNNSVTMMMILKAITKEYIVNKEKVSKVVYYISKINELSQHNFAKYSKSMVEKKNSYMYELDLEHPFILKMINRCK